MLIFLQDSIAAAQDSVPVATEVAVAQVASNAFPLSQALAVGATTAVAFFALVTLLGQYLRFLRRRKLARERVSVHAHALVQVLERLHSKAMIEMVRADQAGTKEITSELDRLLPRVLSLAEMAADSSREMADAIALGVAHYAAAYGQASAAQMTAAMVARDDPAGWLFISDAIEGCEISLVHSSDFFGRARGKRISGAARKAGEQHAESVERRKEADRH